MTSKIVQKATRSRQKKPETVRQPVRASTRSQLRLRRNTTATLQNWREPTQPAHGHPVENATVDCAWGRLIFGHTFPDMEKLARTIAQEKKGRRDIAFYLRDPHVLLSMAPQELFLDPSHTYRLWFENYRPAVRPPKQFIIRKMRSLADARAVNRIYRRRHMMTGLAKKMWENSKSRVFTYLLAEDSRTGEIIGSVMGVDHSLAFKDPENGSSLWSLAVDPQAPYPGIGEMLVRQLAEHYHARGRSFMDLSVLHSNTQAIALYEKLGFQRVPVFCVKHKNPINEELFIAPAPETKLNPYAKIIIREARRRGIGVEILDEEAAYFTLSFGGRSITCRESLTELTTSIAMSRCQDKEVTIRVLRGAGLEVPAQLVSGKRSEAYEFLKRFKRVVVKPADSEQGRGISVDVRSQKELDAAIRTASAFSHKVLIEQFVEGEDLRVIVIDGKVVAAAVRRPAEILGNGVNSVLELIQKQSRRRAAATGGESRIPVDEETERCVRLAGYAMADVPDAGERVRVRKTANLHTGGTIHDVTPLLHPELAEASIRAARALDIPVVGLDLLVPRVDGPDYVFIEANERPGLANHEPQPTAERFIDLLFPQTVERDWT